MTKLVEGELSYRVIGALFKVYNTLGGGYQEKYYQKAVANEFKKQNIKFKEQVHVPLVYEKESIGRYFIDFVVEDKIVLELKATQIFFPRDIKQIYAYLKTSGIPLGILAGFSKDSLKIKRILRGYK
ncbi:MAG: GxxExxY protein [bacterium]|nr:GxxExxY protein [bacterium]